jgi:hypothetical protein
LDGSGNKVAKNVISIEIAMLKRPSRQQLDCQKLTIDQHSMPSE